MDATMPAVSFEKPVMDIAARANVPRDRAEAERAAQKFEGVFISQLLKEMRKTLDEGALFPGDKNDIYGGLFDMFIGEHLAQTQPMGFNKMVAAYLETNQRDTH